MNNTGLHKCETPDCLRLVSAGSAHCCGACALAAAGKYEIHESGPLGHGGAHRNGDGTTWASLGFIEFLQEIPDGDLARFKAAWDAAVARDEAPRTLPSEDTDV